VYLWLIHFFWPEYTFNNYGASRVRIATFSLLMILQAYRCPVPMWVTSQTTPKLPLPSFSPKSYISLRRRSSSSATWLIREPQGDVLLPWLLPPLSLWPFTKYAGLFVVVGNAVAIIIVNASALSLRLRKPSFSAQRKKFCPQHYRPGCHDSRISGTAMGGGARGHAPVRSKKNFGVCNKM